MQRRNKNPEATIKTNANKHSPRSRPLAASLLASALLLLVPSCEKKDPFAQITNENEQELDPQNAKKPASDPSAKASTPSEKNTTTTENNSPYTDMEKLLADHTRSEVPHTANQPNSTNTDHNKKNSVIIETDSSIIGAQKNADAAGGISDPATRDYLEKLNWLITQYENEVIEKTNKNLKPLAIELNQIAAQLKVPETDWPAFIVIYQNQMNRLHELSVLHSDEK